MKCTVCSGGARGVQGGAAAPGGHFGGGGAEQGGGQIFVVVKYCMHICILHLLRCRFCRVPKRSWVTVTAAVRVNRKNVENFFVAPPPGQRIGETQNWGGTLTLCTTLEKATTDCVWRRIIRKYVGLLCSAKPLGKLKICTRPPPFFGDRQGVR